MEFSTAHVVISECLHNLNIIMLFNHALVREKDETKTLIRYDPSGIQHDPVEFLDLY